jgi:hypothetical protein
MVPSLRSAGRQSHRSRRTLYVPPLHPLTKQTSTNTLPVDYNSWQESPEGLALASTLPKSVILAEGYKQFPTNRKYMAIMGDRHANKDEEMPLDGIGGVNILVKADVHRSGINFPAYAFENQAETEGFAKMAKRAGYGVYGLPNYVVWHVDTEERPGNV